MIEEHAHTGGPSSAAEVQIPKIQIEESPDSFQQSPSRHQQPRVSRKRAQSYPAEAHAHALPLLELPTRQTIPAETLGDDQLEHSGEASPKESAQVSHSG